MADIIFDTGWRLFRDEEFGSIIPETVSRNYATSFWPLKMDDMYEAMSSENDYSSLVMYTQYTPDPGTPEQDTLGIDGFPMYRLGADFLNTAMPSTNAPKYPVLFLCENHQSGLFIELSRVSDYYSDGIHYWSTYKVRFGYASDVNDLSTATIFFNNDYVLNMPRAAGNTAEGCIYIGLGIMAAEEKTFLLTQVLACNTTLNDPDYTQPGHFFPDAVGINTLGTIYYDIAHECGRWEAGDIPGITDVVYGSVSGEKLRVFNLTEYAVDNDTEIEIVDDFSDEAGPASGPGGYTGGSFDDSSDSIALPDDPTIGVSNVGFINVYKTGASSLQNIGVELFPALQYTAPSPISSGSTTDAIVDGFNSIVTFLANIPSFFEQSVAATLINYIIDCHVIPVTPSGGTSEQIKVGYKQLTSTGYRLSNDYVTFDCGSISLNEYYSNFADFSATQAKLFLPFVGFVPARPEWFYRDSLNVTYKFNIVDGSFVAYVRSTGTYVNNNNQGSTIVGQYSGNACVHLPITGVTYSNMVSGLVGAGAGAVSSAGSGNVAGVATSALNASTLHGDIPNSNSYSSSGSFLSVRRPFLMIERAVSNYSKTYQRELGIPSNISMKLSKVHGFATVGNIHLDGITATDQEKAELETLLSKGVIF